MKHSLIRMAGRLIFLIDLIFKCFNYKIFVTLFTLFTTNDVRNDIICIQMKCTYC
jgi:hypothetical protein